MQQLVRGRVWLSMAKHVERAVWVLVVLGQQCADKVGYRKLPNLERGSGIILRLSWNRMSITFLR